MLINEPHSNSDLKLLDAIRVTTSPLSSMQRVLDCLVLPVILGTFLVPFLVLLFYSVPAADDFCKATLAYNGVRQPSVMAITWMYYIHWSPRWLTTFLQSLIMSKVNLVQMYGWLLFMVVLTNLASLWYFFLAVVRLKHIKGFLAAVVFYAAWLASLGSPSQQVYWLTGAMEYNLSLSSLLVLVSLLLRSRPAVWYYIAVSLLSIAVSAQHEIAGTFLWVVLLGGTVVSRIKRLPTRQWYLSFSLATVSLATVVMSPGNAARGVQEHRHLWDTGHALGWIAHSFYHGLSWLSAPAILVSACCIGLFSRPSLEPKAGDKLPRGWICLACLCAMLVILFQSAFIEIATGTWLPPRVAGWLEFVFSLLFVCAAQAGLTELRQLHFSFATRMAVFGLFAISLFSCTNFREAVEDLRGPAETWHRLNVLRLSQRGGSLKFEDPPQYPALGESQRLTRKAGCWENRCLANYLHAESVVMVNSIDECSE